jgi:hypothetical protein
MLPNGLSTDDTAMPCQRVSFDNFVMVYGPTLAGGGPEAGPLSKLTAAEAAGTPATVNAAMVARATRKCRMEVLLRSHAAGRLLGDWGDRTAVNNP